jgi:Cohesin domain/SprB repeat
MRFLILTITFFWASLGFAVAQCDLSPLQPVNSPGQVLYADEECTDASGWTHYYNSTSNRILLSIKKNGQDIGSLDLNLDVKVGTLATFGTEGHNLSGADYIDNEIWIVANRYWQVTGANAIANPVQVRFYLSNTDIGDIANIVDDFGFFVDEAKDLYMFTIASGNGLDPMSTSTQPFNAVYTLYDMFAGGPPEWTVGDLNGFPFGEFAVSTLDIGGGAGFLIFQNAAPLTISGNIARTNGNPVPDVTVQAASISTGTTNANGDYTCPSLLSGSDYEVVPHKDINHLEGITVADLLAVSQHINGSQPINDPYKLIAANTNSDTVISFPDLTALRNLLMGISPNFPNSTSWRFVPADYGFPVPTHPFTPQFPESILAPNLQDSLFNQDFIGIKIGDVVSPSTATPPALNTAFKLPALNACNPGDTVVFDLTVQDFQSIRAFQFTLEWNPVVMQYLSATNFNLTNFNANNIGGATAGSGKMAFVWTNNQNAPGNTSTLPNGASFVKLRFIATGNIGSSTPLSFTNSIATMMVIHQNNSQAVPGSTAGSFIIDNNTTISASAFLQTASCAGPGTGAIDLTATGGTGALSYQWSNGATTQDIFGLQAGTYSVTINDASGGCPLVKSFEVMPPAAMSLTANVTDMLCPYFANGAIELLVNGGEVPYSYQWSNGRTQRIIENLNEGNYTVTVTDGAGCTSTASFEVENNNFISPVVMVTNASNAGKNDGSLMMTSINGGTGPFSFLWNNGATTMNLMDLLPGDYVVTITDGVGCQHVFGYEVFGLFTGTVEAGSSLEAVNVFPNPVRAGEAFSLVFSMKNAGKISATIFAADGKIVGRERFNLPVGQTVQQLKAPSANGFYIVYFEMDGLSVGRLKLLVQ